MVDKQPAPQLQSQAQQFFEALGWRTKQSDPQMLLATKRVAGKELRWALHFEDEGSFSQLTSPPSFAQALLSKAADQDFFDLICTDRVLSTRRWSDEIRPIVEARFRGLRNRQFGTWTSFLNRFAGPIAEAQISAFEPIFSHHFIRKPVRARFSTGVDALNDCVEWLRGSTTRIMLVTGGPGAGKSVFSLSLAKEIYALYQRDANTFPAPFLVWFSTDRTSVLEELIAVTLQDLHLTDLTPEAVKFLVRHGRILFILDGFDEISRASARSAEETIDELSQQINRKTNGRLILTSRPAFLAHEEIYFELTAACDEDKPEQRDIAPYTDNQQRDWVIQNAPEDPQAQPADRHWQRVQTAFSQHEWLRELCRIPVFLRMLSEVLIKESSVRSRDDLLTKFCKGMWERERGKRKLPLSDSQYLLAYEAISAAIVELGRIDPKDVKDWLAMYLDQDARPLLAELPEDSATLVKDLAIGPLTGRDGNFAFEHEILTGYFFARLMARALRESDSRARELWNRRIFEPAWQFLPEAISLAISKPGADLITELARTHKDGLMVWNVARAVGSPLPRNLFKGKDLADVTFENAKPNEPLDLRNMIFDGCSLYSVVFSDCDLSGTSFRNARFGRVRFVNCRPGATFDTVPLFTGTDPEIVLVRTGSRNEEVYSKDDIARAFTILAGNERRESLASLPKDMAERAAIVIFRSLYKSDEVSLDYPEVRKIENRLRAWLQGFELPHERRSDYFSLFMKLFRELESRGWISPNRNRPRTRKPGDDREQTVGQIVRSGIVPVHLGQLKKVFGEFQTKLDGQTS